MLKSLFTVSLLVSSSLCQRSRTQSLYGQCGGKDWTGPVACPTGSYCKNDGINNTDSNTSSEWYSQCVSIEANQPVGDSPITTTIRTTTISVIGPTPTVVTTFITYLTPVTPPAATTITLVPDEPYTPTWP
ncbi:hypothetical protein BR93DRAFT_982747 [Coniochaeta sp. PMI_546]|nr:hypothetical protein BR93DRAFT_982747 [Coniochaeta sp. PMI_546]